MCLTLFGKMFHVIYHFHFDSFYSPVDTKRHISCEPCLEKVSGGFDPKTMQVIYDNVSSYFE